MRKYYRENPQMNRMELPAMTAERQRDVKIRDVMNESSGARWKREGMNRSQSCRENSMKNTDTFTANMVCLAVMPISGHLARTAAIVLTSGISGWYAGELKRKVDIFTKRTIRRAETVTSVDNRQRSTLLYRWEGRRWPFLYGTASGKTEEELTEELAGVIFKNPISEKWEPMDEHLSGKCEEKLQIANSLQKSTRGISGERAVFEQVQPKDSMHQRLRQDLGQPASPRITLHGLWQRHSIHQDIM